MYHYAARLVSVGSLCAVILLAESRASAAQSYNDASGVAVDDLTNGASVDLGASTGVVADGQGGYVLATPGQPGVLVTQPFSPISGGAWREVQLATFGGTATSFSVQVLSADGLTSLGSVALTPSTLAGFTYKAPLAGIDAAANPSIRLRISIDDAGASLAPALDTIRVSWAPKAGVAISALAASSACSSATITYDVPLSVSTIGASGLAAVLEAPAPESAPYAASPLTFASASHGGQVNSGAPFFIGDLNVPTGAVYWYFAGTTAPGSTFIATAAFRVPGGADAGTVYRTRASAVATNADLVTSADVTFAVISRPAPEVFLSFGETYRIDGSDRADANAVVVPRILVRNQAATCRQPYHDAVIIHDLRTFESAGGSGLGADPAAISDGGVFVPDGATVAFQGSVNVTGPAVVWELDEISVGQLKSLSYSLTLGDAPPLADDDLLHSIALAKSAYHNEYAFSQHDLIVGVPSSPVGLFSTGNGYGAEKQISAKSNDLPKRITAYGASFATILYARNGGISELRDIQAFLKIPAGTTFQSASAPPGTTLYYHTGGSGAAPSDPTFDIAPGQPGSAWTTVEPAASSLTWVAAIIDHLDSPYGAPPNAVLSAEVPVELYVPAPPDGCGEQTIRAIGVYTINSYVPLGGGAAQPAPGAGTFTTDEEPMTVRGVLPDLGRTKITGPDVRIGAGPVAYSINVTNASPLQIDVDTARDVVLTIDLPTITVNGVETWLPYDSIDAAGGSVDLDALEDGQIVVRWPSLPPLATRPLALNFVWPRGGRDGDQATLNVNVSAQDDVCGAVTSAASRTTALDVRPALVVDKSVDIDVAQVGEMLSYDIVATNIGDGVSTNTMLVDALPVQTTLVAVLPDDPNALVYVAASLPAAYRTDYGNPIAFTPALLTSGAFQLAEPQVDGSWTSSIPNPRWIAVTLDDPTLNPPLMAIGSASGAVVIVEVSPGNVGTQFHNRALIAASEVLPAISPPARTTIADVPAARIVRQCLDVVAAGETFTYDVEVWNSSSTDASELVLSELIPAGLQYVAATFTWNAAAAANSAIVVAPQVEGQSVVFDLTGAVGGPLPSLYGGVATITVTVDAGITTGTFLTPNATVHTANDGDLGGVDIGGACTIRVSNADLWTRVSVDRANPIAGDTVTVTVLVSNVDAHVADGVGAAVTLPAGMNYVPNSARAPGAYRFNGTSEPAIAAGTLSWTTAPRQFIGPSGVVGRLDGNSGNAIITFQAVVGGAVVPDTALSIEAVATTTTGQGSNVRPDTATVALRTPLPNLYAVAYAPATAAPSATINTVIEYGNLSPQGTNGVVIVALPNEGGAQSGSYVSHAVTNGELVYFHDGALTGPAPAFDPANPGANGWVTDPTLLAGSPSRIAVDTGPVGAYAGPSRITLTTNFADPITGTLAIGGTSHTVCATFGAAVGGLAGDDDPSDNTACSTTALPGVNITALATLSPGGVYPGVAAGGDVSGVLTLINTGTVPAYGLSFNTTLAGLTRTGFAPPPVTIVTTEGAAANAIDATGSAILGAIPVSLVGNTYTLGSLDSGSSVYYRNVGLPAGTQVSFDASYVAATAIDGAVASVSMVADVDYQPTWNPGTDPAEELLADNTSLATVTIYRADLVATIAGLDSGDSDGVAKAGDTITWTVEYNNIGGIDATDTTLTTTIPAGVAFVVNSIAGGWSGSTVRYLGPAGWGYTPTGTSDANVRAVQLAGAMPSPVNDFFDLSGAELNQGTFGGTKLSNGRLIATTNTNNTYTIGPVGIDDDIVRWQRLRLSDRRGDDPLYVAVLDPSTGAPIAGYEAVPVDSSGAIDLSGLSAATYQSLSFELTFGGGGLRCDPTNGETLVIDGGDTELKISQTVPDTFGDADDVLPLYEWEGQGQALRGPDDMFSFAAGVTTGGGSYVIDGLIINVDRFAVSVFDVAESLTVPVASVATNYGAMPTGGNIPLYPVRWTTFADGTIGGAYNYNSARMRGVAVRYNPATRELKVDQLSFNASHHYSMIGMIAPDVIVARNTSAGGTTAWILNADGTTDRADLAHASTNAANNKGTIGSNVGTACHTTDVNPGTIPRAFVLVPPAAGVVPKYPVRYRLPEPVGALRSLCNRHLGGGTFAGLYRPAGDTLEHAGIWFPDAGSVDPSGYTFLALPDGGARASSITDSNDAGWLVGNRQKSDGTYDVVTWIPDGVGGYTLTPIVESSDAAVLAPAILVSDAIMTYSATVVKGALLAADGQSYAYHETEVVGASALTFKKQFATRRGFHAIATFDTIVSHVTFELIPATGIVTTVHGAPVRSGYPQTRFTSGRFAGGAVIFGSASGITYTQPAIWAPGPTAYEMVKLPLPVGYPPTTTDSTAHGMTPDGSIVIGELKDPGNVSHLATWIRQFDGSYQVYDVTAELGHDSLLAYTFQMLRYLGTINSGWAGHVYRATLNIDGSAYYAHIMLNPASPFGVDIYYARPFDDFAGTSYPSGYYLGDANTPPYLLGAQTSPAGRQLVEHTLVGGVPTQTVLPNPPGATNCSGYYFTKARPQIAGPCEGLDFAVIWTRDSAGGWSVETIEPPGYTSTNVSAILNDGVFLSYFDGSQWGQGLFRKHNGVWTHLQMTVPGLDVDPGSESLANYERAAQHAAMDGYLYGSVSSGGATYYVVWPPAPPGATELAGIVIEGGQSSSFGHYLGDGIFDSLNPPAIIRPDGAGGYIADRLSGLGVSSIVSNPVFPTDRQRVLGVSLNAAIHGFNYGLLLVDAEGAHQIVPTQFKQEINSGSQSDPVPLGDAEIFGFNNWSMYQLVGCSYASDASFDGLAVQYQAQGNPTFSFDTEVLTQCQQNVTASVTAATSTPEIRLDNNADAATIDIENADIAVAVTVDKRLAAEGTVLTWTATVTNLGAHDATGVALSFGYPLALGLPAENVLLGAVGVGASSVRTFSGTVPVGLADGARLTAAATVTRDQLDCTTSNDTASATTLVSSQPNVSVTLVAPAVAQVGTPFVVTVSYVNSSDATFDAGTINLTLPGSLSLNSGSASMPIGPLAPGEAGSFEVTLAATDCAAIGDLAPVEARLDAATDVLGDDDADVADVEVLDAEGRLSVAIIPDRTDAVTGDTIRWTVHYRNDGTAPITGGVITAPVPTGAAFVPGSLTRGSETGGVLTIGLPDPLADGASGAVSFLAVVTAPDGATLAGVANFTGTGACPVTTAYADVEIGTPTTRVIKTADRAVVCGGGAVTWSIVVVNEGSDSLEDIVITDMIADGTTLVGGSMTGGDSSSEGDGSSIRWNLTSLPPGQGFTVTFQTSAPTSDGDLVSNAAVMTYIGGIGRSNQAIVRVDCDEPFALSLDWDGGCAAPGDTVTLTFAWTNAGLATDAVISHVVPAGLTFANTATGTYSAGSDTVSWTLSAASGASGSVTYTATVDPDATTLLIHSGSATTTDGRSAVSNALGGPVVLCDDGDPCTTDSCDAGTGCTAAPADDGTLCDTGDLCSVGVCGDGTCVGTLKDCTATDQCLLDGACVPETGECAYPNAPDETSCDDGLDCTSDDQCSGGVCGGSDTCATEAGICDADGFCNPATNSCEFGAAPCQAERFDALVVNGAGDVVGAIRCTMGSVIICDEEADGTLTVYDTFLSCEP